MSTYIGLTNFQKTVRFLAHTVRICKFYGTKILPKLVQCKHRPFVNSGAMAGHRSWLQDVLMTLDKQSRWWNLWIPVHLSTAPWEMLLTNEAVRPPTCWRVATATHSSPQRHPRPISEIFVKVSFLADIFRIYHNNWKLHWASSLSCIKVHETPPEVAHSFLIMEQILFSVDYGCDIPWTRDESISAIPVGSMGI